MVLMGAHSSHGVEDNLTSATGKQSADESLNSVQR